jgi:hypothetical protein
MLDVCVYVLIRDEFLQQSCDAVCHRNNSPHYISIGIQNIRFASFLFVGCYEMFGHSYTGSLYPAIAPAGFWSNTQFWASECHPWQGSYYLFASFVLTGASAAHRSWWLTTPKRPIPCITMGQSHRAIGSASTAPCTPVDGNRSKHP